MSFAQFAARNKLSNVIFLAAILLSAILLFDKAYHSISPTDCPYTWHGGSPSGSHRGSCWCGADSYCMCTPSLAIDCIIEYQGNVVLVWRKDPPAGSANCGARTSAYLQYE